jgi:hypothetical protein
LVNVTSSGGRIYTGGTGSGETSTTIGGAAASVNGMVVCSSGSFTGTTCGITVTNPNAAILVQGNVVDVVDAQAGTGVCISGPGDSGSPIYFPIGTSGSAFAVGIISAGDPSTHPATCKGIPRSGCSSRVFYPAINAILAAQSVTLR